ncbi:MAG: GDP-L-fucose synthase [Methanoregula sp.]|jgi:GDP-L-fucose synthase|uniref:GDP-L-fucose synthase family protein n=1 Tax=Methanoregula sp. TaxID=2052170 RepID=UPI003C16AE6E
MSDFNQNSTIYVAGHNGMVGSAIMRLLQTRGFDKIITRSSKELDLRDGNQVGDFLRIKKPEFIFLAAAKVGGIQANSIAPASFLYDNLMIQANIIHQSYLHGVKKILVLGSSCIYPKDCPQPMKEGYLLSGKLEPTNEGYALAKIVALKQAEYYQKQYGFNAISVMPPNLYGPNDSFDLGKSHVLSALVRRFVDAVDTNNNEITLWGSGSARREFMHVDDLAEALLFFMQNYNDPEFINIGWGADISIKELAEKIAYKTGYRGKILWDLSKPDGMLRKCMDVSKSNSLGYHPKISLDEGISYMIEYYKQQKRNGAII